VNARQSVTFPNMIDFSLTPELQDFKERTAAFIADEIIPMERDPRLMSHDEHGPSEELRLEVVAKARAAGLIAPHLGTEYGGLGLSHVGKAVVFEEAGYSPVLGPLALAIAAPDEGNGHLLEQVGSDDQKEQFLRPLCAGEVRSMFTMTEPDGGAGSDPSMMKTVAVETGDNYVINGTKWLITGALGAAFAIVMARTIDAEGNDVGATMFLCDAKTPGIEIVETLDTMDSNSVGGHSVMQFNNLEVHKSQVLGEVGKGFRYAQVRLGPARLTHCMRWLGAARRAHDIATDYARTREAFGKTLGEHEGVGFQLADNLVDMHACRLMIWQCGWVLDQGDQARLESSMAKLYCSESLSKVVDRCVQVLGGTGITGRTVVRGIYEDIRAFRIYDGPSEVHRWSIARQALKA
jgi:acyl-CoA dehydrogenase